MVLVFHAGFPFLKGGYIGVDVFFVISGYLITRLLIIEQEKHGCIKFLAFYARRIRRLLPAATVALAGTALVSFFLFSPLEQSNLIRSFFVSILYVSNLWFAFQATDYLGEDTNADPFLHTWSLSVEEQFYLIWPFLILLATLKKTGSNQSFKLTILIGSVFVISFFSSLIMGGIYQPWAFFGSPFRAWEFATGALGFLLVHRKIHLPEPIHTLGVSVGIGAILLAGILYDKSTPFPGLYALLPTAGTLLVLIGDHQKNWFVDLSQIPWIRWLGDISYSLYLWHWPLIVIPLSLTGELSLGERMGLVAVSLALGNFSYKYIENPIRFNQKLARSTFKGLALGATLTIFGISLTFTLRSFTKAELNTPLQKDILAARSLIPTVYQDGCHASYAEILFSECSYGEPSSPKTLVLFGDSHAAQWFPAIEAFSKQHGYRLVSLTKSACPAAHIIPYNTAYGRSYTECGAWQELVLERIAKERPLLVILSNSSSYSGTGEDSNSNPEWWIQGMKETLATIQRTGAQVAIIRDTPSFSQDIPICLSRAAWTGTPLSNCDDPKIQVLNQTFFAFDQEAASDFPTVHFMDFSKTLCPEDKCPARINGHTGYRDHHHLAIPTVLDLAESMHDELRDILP
ncbi:MAG: acyltransferase [Nitrospiraceae bacterium]|nr:acyltransferase [Nitrospira sp.]MCB9773791.1 acyltransferase [Nitrospiraceae bacterium]